MQVKFHCVNLTSINLRKNKPNNTHVPYATSMPQARCIVRKRRRGDSDDVLPRWFVCWFMFELANNKFDPKKSMVKKYVLLWHGHLHFLLREKFWVLSPQNPSENHIFPIFGHHNSMSLSYLFPNMRTLCLVTLCKTKWECHSFPKQWHNSKCSGHDHRPLL